jgi:mono/diheme cytochrome c family protein
MAADLRRIFCRATTVGKRALRIMTTRIAALLATALSIGLLMPAPLFSQEYPADVSRGKTIYERHCTTCHGPRGHGDGPNALLLTIAPADFHRPGSFLKSDESLLRMIEHGGVFSPMHSWRGRLTDGEMQDVLAYIRALSQDSR